MPAFVVKIISRGRDYVEIAGEESNGFLILNAKFVESRKKVTLSVQTA